MHGSSYIGTGSRGLTLTALWNIRVTAEISSKPSRIECEQPDFGLVS